MSILSLQIILFHPNSDTANGAKVILSENNLLFHISRFQRGATLSSAFALLHNSQREALMRHRQQTEIQILWNLLPVHAIIIVPYSENFIWGSQCYFMLLYFYFQHSNKKWIIATVGRVFSTSWSASATFSCETEPQPFKQHAVDTRDACAQAAFSQVSHRCHFCIHCVHLNSWVWVKLHIKVLLFCAISIGYPALTHPLKGIVVALEVQGGD